MPERLYLDHAATTPILAAARHAWVEASLGWANPSSPHAEGRRARAAVEEARARVAAALGWTGTVIFTSGASEAIQIALTRANADRVWVSDVEHDSVLRLVPDAGRIAVDGQGRVAALPELGQGALLAIQHANSETGVIQPLGEIAAQVRGAGGVLFADCAQTAGKLPLPDADLIAIGAHKFGGPPGIGALLVRDLALLKPSGGQERGYRPGTENLPAIMAMATALEAGNDWLEHAAQLRAELDLAIVQAGGAVIAADAPRIATIASYAMPGVPARAQLIRFDMSGIAVSAGSACSSGTMKGSHVLEAMRLPAEIADSAVRVSFGRDTDRAAIERFVTVWRAIATDAKGRGA